MISRRRFITGFVTGLTPLAATASAQEYKAQQRARTWRVGFLSGGAPPPDGAPPLPLRQALQELGYVEHQSVIYHSDHRFTPADGSVPVPMRFPSLS